MWFGHFTYRFWRNYIYESILVPLDGSPFAEQELPYASRISLELGIPIQLMQVLHTLSKELADPTPWPLQKQHH